MPGNLLHANATVMCPHGGQVAILPSQTRVLVGGQPVWTVADFSTITGCPFVVANVPHPCVTVRWVTPSTRQRVNGSAVITQASTGLCLAADQAPQGSPVITVIQQRVAGE